MQVGSYGNIIFEVSDSKIITPSSIQRERKVAYAEHKVHGQLPRLEYLAPELATMGMNIRLLSSLGVDPIQEANKLSKMSKQGSVARLIIMGVNCGYMIIESISQTWRHITPQSIHSIDVSLKFKEYV